MASLVAVDGYLVRQTALAGIFAEGVMLGVAVSPEAVEELFR